MAVKWRLKLTNTETGESRLVWAAYRTKKEATAIAEAFEAKVPNSKVEVIRQEER